MSSPAPPIGEDFGDKKEEISVLDPRRFTPTLHANLVSEILSLRRDLENKNSIVLNLEESLAGVQDENAKLQETLAKHVRENKSVKHQMDTLEGGTLSAIEDLAKERDKATESLVEVKQRLEASQKRARTQEQDAERAQIIYERDREKWEVERRILDRKVHVVESRLRTVLSEVESAQAQVHAHQRTASHETASRSYSRERPASRASGTRSAASRHRDSTNTNDSDSRHFRLSNAVSNNAGAKTLADELQFDEGSDNESEGGYISPEALPEERPRPFSVQSHRQSIKARKLLGLAIDDENEEEKGIGREVPQDFPAQAADSLHAQDTPLPAYVDSSTQYSLPASLLELDPQRLSTITEFENDSVLEEIRDTGRQVTQTPLSAKITSVVMVSSACQTVESPLSPPETPTNDTEVPSVDKPKAKMVTASTQTIQDDLYASSAATNRDVSSTIAEIPTIAIHAVGSESARSSIVLPPHTKNASCQTSISPPMRSASVQTEGIRTDERLEKLPAHLHPTKILPYSPSTSPSPEVQKPQSAQPIALQNSLQRPSRSRPSSLRRSITEDSVVRRDFADESRVNTGDDDGHCSDDSFLRREPLKKTLTKVQDSWKLVSQTDEEGEDEADARTRPRRLPSLDLGPHELRSDQRSKEQKSPQKKFEERSGKILTPIVTERPNDLKRTALISSGSAAHVQRGRSPSEPAKLSRHSGPIPPFPVPDRSSSKKLPWSPSEGSGSPTSRTSRENIKRQGRPPTKKPAMRKSRSAIGSGYGETRSRSRSPPPPFESFAESLTSIPPPLPENEITSPFSPSFQQPKSSHRHEKSVTSAAESSSSDQTSVVDAIAQAMIGEWMWKYVRRRKSFNLADTAVNEYDSAQGKYGMMTGGLRHQRWVWVAPYERAVMWSSKQPTSGSALMGKSGRKCMRLLGARKSSDS